MKETNSAEATEPVSGGEPLKQSRVMRLTTKEGIDRCLEQKWSLTELAAEAKEIELEGAALEALQQSSLAVVVQLVEKNDLLALRGAEELLEALGATPLFDQLPIVMAINRFLPLPSDERPKELLPFKGFLEFFAKSGFAKLDVANLSAHVHAFLEKLERLKG